jgi:hypothetical protein
MGGGKKMPEIIDYVLVDLPAKLLHGVLTPCEATDLQTSLKVSVLRDTPSL